MPKPITPSPVPYVATGAIGDAATQTAVRALTQGWQTATHGVKGESPVLSLPALTTLVRRQEETLRAQQTELDYFAARLETLQQQQQSLLAYLGGLLEGFALEEDESEEDSGEAEEELNSTT